MKREAAVSLEDVEIRRLQEKILRNGFSEDKKFNNHIKRENGHLQVRPSIIRHANSAKIKSEPVCRKVELKWFHEIFYSSNLYYFVH